MFFKKLVPLFIACLMYNNVVMPMDVPSCKIIEFQHLQGHTGPVTALATLFLENAQQYIVSGSVDTTIRMWDFKTKECLHVLEGHTQPVTCIKTHKLGIFSGSADTMVKVWNPWTGECIATLVGHTKEIIKIECIDDNHLASLSSDGHVIIWDLKEGRAIKTFIDMISIDLHRSLYLAYLGDNIIATGSKEWIHIWDISNKPLCLQTLEIPCDGYSVDGLISSGTYLIAQAGYPIEGGCNEYQGWNRETQEYSLHYSDPSDQWRCKDIINVSTTRTLAASGFSSLQLVLYDHCNEKVIWQDSFGGDVADANVIATLDSRIICGSPKSNDLMISREKVLPQ